MGKGLGKVTMPGRHGCKEGCEGCQLRRCCCRPYMGWGDFFPHLCSHCRTLYKMMTLEDVRSEVVRILRAHAAELEQAAHARRRVRVLPWSRRSAVDEPWTAPYLMNTTVFA